MGFRPRTQELEIENIDEGQEDENNTFKEGLFFILCIKEMLKNNKYVLTPNYY